MGETMDTWRCPKCNRILAKLRLTPGSQIEVKCRSCNTYSFRATDAPALAATRS